jgi:hypothetical protein
LNGDGFLGDIKFQADGTITLYDNFNEKFWTFDGKVVTILDYIINLEMAMENGMSEGHSCMLTTGNI